MLALLRWLGVFSMVIGGLLATGQWDMKRLFAYSSISQVGYMVLGLGLGTPLGVVGALYHLVNHSVFKSLLFLNAGAVEHATGTRDLKRLGGLRQAMPVTGFTSLVASMSMAGIPPLNGFWSKLIIIVACVQSGFFGFAVGGGRHEHRDAGLSAQGAALRVLRGASRGVRAIEPGAPADGGGHDPSHARLRRVVVAGAFRAREPWLITAAEQTLLAGVFDLE